MLSALIVRRYKYKEIIMHWIYAHLIGDYILQNDWMALHKKKSSFRCAVHIVFYMIPFLWCDISWIGMILIAIQHYAIDRSNFVGWFMKVKGQNEFATGICFPWSQIVMDNILHILWVAFIVEWDGLFYLCGKLISNLF